MGELKHNNNNNNKHEVIIKLQVHRISSLVDFLGLTVDCVTDMFACLVCVCDGWRRGKGVEVRVKSRVGAVGHVTVHKFEWLLGV